MKKITAFSLFLILRMTISAQECSIETLKMIGLPYDEETKKITFTGVVEVQNLSKDKLYALVKNELILLFKNSKPVSLLDDTVQDRYVIQSTFELRRKTRFLIFFNNHFYNVIFTLLFDFKDNKFKYTLTDYYVYDAEAPILTSSSVSWIDGVSTTKLRENKIKLYPFEQFFENERNRRDRLKIFPSFKEMNASLIESIINISDNFPNDNDW